MKLLRNTLANLDIDRFQIVQADLPAGLQRLSDRYPRHFQLVFADPPYDFEDYENILEGAVALLATDGTIGIEHDGNATLPDRAGGLSRHDTRVYGGSRLSFYSRESA